MKAFRVFCLLSIMLFVFGAAAAADDFDWVEDLNIQAQADPSGFKARLGGRFKVGPVQIDAVMSNCKEPADAYMVFRLGEMSGRSTDEVLEKYRSGKGKGWGKIAQGLGIKPGSKEFHALKSGSDLDGEKGKDKESKGKEEEKGEAGKGKEGGKGKGKKDK